MTGSLKTLCLLAAATLFAGGCASPTPTPEQFPPDFTVSITVLGKPGSRMSRPREMRPARYVLGPDQTLHALVTKDPKVAQYPPPMRQLREAQYAEVWTLVRQGGYLDLPASAHIAESETIQPEVKKPTAVVFVRGVGRERSILVELESENAKPTRALIDKLGELAWIEP